MYIFIKHVSFQKTKLSEEKMFFDGFSVFLFVWTPKKKKTPPTQRKSRKQVTTLELLPKLTVTITNLSMKLTLRIIILANKTFSI